MNEMIIEAVQRRLQELGWYGGRIDGDAGDITTKAFVAFKTAEGLNPREYVGPITLTALFDEDAKSKHRSIADDEPPWMIEARSVMGLHEAKDYRELSSWLVSDGSTIGDPRKYPWCGDYVQTAVRNTLPDETIPKNPYLSRNWLKFGVHCSPALGAVLVFWRGSRSGIYGHVGFYAGEDSETYHVLGGNQSNAVTIARLRKGRLLGARWPATYTQNTDAVDLAGEGEISENEA